MSDAKKEGVIRVPADVGDLAPGDETAAGTIGSGESLCPACNGTGMVGTDDPCPNCGGTGKIIEGIGGG
ncbi:hypothetical protein SAMN05216548_101212 [Faunimonas pinastri]|uniref:Molecular chaperone DnaJ n=1 Tax=Faunimonas pinastri TaxID=1855383 RepID=A0A1H8ZPU8_9HYPH|nr:hypothetical protein [Faunimonas pinastri]SEP66432.1 hypothetical protein SAMN05216548_101212 [Faunimonas pinastri]